VSNPNRSGLCKNELWFILSEAVCVVSQVPLYKIKTIFWACALLVSLYLSPAQAVDDDYLSEISIEAKKVESDSLSGVGGSSGSKGMEGIEKDGARSAFEADLKARYRGSYTFYNKLPLTSRDEIYQHYREGASISDIREKIMERFLKR
jgi:hypothetical protein